MRLPSRSSVLTGAAVVLVVATAAGLLAYRFWDPGRGFDIRGIDVSHHQGSIDWETLSGDGVQFAYIKATEGADWTDSRFTENWRAAGDAGVLRGAYHFFTLCTPGVDQAVHMIATVPDEIGMLPPAVDLEFGGNCAARPGADVFRNDLDEFLELIAAHYRMRPVVYTNPDFYGQYLEVNPPDVTWWMMSPVREPPVSPDWTFWQYFPGYRDGIEGRVDRNVFRSTEGDLRSLTRRRSS